MIRLGACRAHLRQSLDERPKLGNTTSGRHAPLQFPVVGQQCHAIARIKRHLREAQRRIHRMVELVEPVDARSQEPAQVQHEPHGLAALNLVYLGDQLPLPGRDAPGNVAEFVSGAIFPQAFELSSMPPLPLESLFELDLAATNQVDANLTRLAQIRIDTLLLTDASSRPPLREAQRAAVAEPDIAKLCVSAFAGFDR